MQVPAVRLAGSSFLDRFPDLRRSVHRDRRRSVLPEVSSIHLRQATGTITTQPVPPETTAASYSNGHNNGNGRYNRGRNRAPYALFLAPYATYPYYGFDDTDRVRLRPEWRSWTGHAHRPRYAEHDGWSRSIGAADPAAQLRGPAVAGAKPADERLSGSSCRPDKRRAGSAAKHGPT